MGYCITMLHQPGLGRQVASGDATWATERSYGADVIRRHTQPLETDIIRLRTGIVNGAQASLTLVLV
jgi:hypothetical protein